MDREVRSNTEKQLSSIGIDAHEFFSNLVPESVPIDSYDVEADVELSVNGVNVTEFIESQQERPESQFVIPTERLGNRNDLLNGTQ